MNDNTSNQSKSLEFGSVIDSVISQYKANFGNISIKYIIIMLIQWATIGAVSIIAVLAIGYNNLSKVESLVKQIQAIQPPNTATSDQLSSLASSVVQFLPAVLIYIAIIIVVGYILSAFLTSFLTRSTNRLARDNQQLPIGDMFGFNQDYYLIPISLNTPSSLQ